MLNRFSAIQAVVVVALAIWLYPASSIARDCDAVPRTTEEAQAQQAEREALKTAAANGDVAALERLVRAGACLHASQWLGPSPLIQAVANNQLDAVRWLLRAEVNLEDRDQFSQKQTALMWAAAEDRHDILLELVAAGADLNARADDGWTALVWCAAKGKLNAVDDLIAAGADPAVRDEVGWTAIMYARHYGHENIVDRLRDLGAAGDTRIVDLIQAIRRNDTAAVSALLA